MAKKKTLPIAAALSLDTFRAANQQRPAIPCTLAAFLLTLSAADRATVRAAIADPSIQATAIARVLRDRGWTSTDQVVLKHRKGVCVTCSHDAQS